jgi:hypothetical protein
MRDNYAVLSRAGMNVFEAVRCLKLEAGPHHQRGSGAAPAPHGSDHFHMGAKVVPVPTAAPSPWMPPPPPAPLPPAPTPPPPPVPHGDEGHPAVPAYTTSAAGSGSTRTSASLTDDYGLGHDSTDGAAEPHYPAKPPQPTLQEQPHKESMGKGGQDPRNGENGPNRQTSAAAGKGSSESDASSKAAALLSAEAVTAAGLEMYERFGLLVQDMRGENPRFAYMLMVRGGRVGLDVR